jgi:fused signal recognition particle receptor
MVDFLNKWKEGLERTRKVAFGRISNLMGTSQITTDTWADLEAALIQADMGIETAQAVLDSMKKQVLTEGFTRSSELQSSLRSELINRLQPAPTVVFPSKPSVILIVGVNGSGKTTTIAKLGKLFANSGKRVILVAGDTYRAAAVDQLQIWGERLDLPVIASQMGADPGAIAYDGIQAAIARKADLVLIDTAGRLHTRFNLMEELKKVYRVVGKALPGAPHATWLVLDATTGQNALQQARAFKDAVKINAVILAKLDTSARGGMAFAIKDQLNLPIIYAGLGEKPDDLQIFDREAFVDGILATT